MYEHRIITEDMLDKAYKASQLKDGRWFSRIPVAYDKETKKYKYKTVYGKNQKDVLKKTRYFIRDEVAKQNLTRETDELFTSVFENWLYGYKLDKVKDTTFDRYEQTYLYQIKSGLADSKLKDISGEDLQDILKSVFDMGYSYSSILKVYRLLGDFFAHQTKQDCIDKNPMLKVEMYSRDEVSRKQEKLRDIRDSARQKKESNMPLTEMETALTNSKLRICDKEEIRFFNDEEIAKIKAIAEIPFINGIQGIKQAKIFVLMLNIGLRAGEMQALKYCDIDWENKTIGITKNIVSVKTRDENGRCTGSRKTKQGKVKTKHSYQEYLDVNDTALNILKELREEEPDDYDGYIIHNGNNPLTPRAFEKRFYNLLKKAGIEKTGLHTLRHTFASKLYEQTNGDTKLVSELLRHGSVSFTAQTYIHLEGKYKRKHLNAFAV